MASDGEEHHEFADPELMDERELEMTELQAEEERRAERRRRRLEAEAAESLIAQKEQAKAARKQARRGRKRKDNDVEQLRGIRKIGRTIFVKRAKYQPLALSLTDAEGTTHQLKLLGGHSIPDAVLIVLALVWVWVCVIALLGVCLRAALYTDEEHTFLWLAFGAGLALNGFIFFAITVTPRRSRHDLITVKEVDLEKQFFEPDEEESKAAAGKGFTARVGSPAAASSPRGPDLL